MSFLDRLNGAALIPVPSAPVLVLSHLGTEPEVLAMLGQGQADAHLTWDQEDFIGELANAAHTIGAFEPLVGYRYSAEETAPDHPWYGAERTDPKGMATYLARGAALHFRSDAESGPRRMILINRRIYWNAAECKPLLDFILGWDEAARVLMVSGPEEAASAALAERQLWRLEAAQNAVLAMTATFGDLKEEYGDRAMIWDAPVQAPDQLPPDIAAFLA